jgi:hypothetical protein
VEDFFQIGTGGLDNSADIEVFRRKNSIEDLLSLAAISSSSFFG